ncbi:hypothetical protein CGLO_17440 [Colletotrichum gloeosporioides Cg-14]|uniref:Uncharacterized protein n=1 Tax=Colletotrichum gloeosporioides (strain Cg-14) TaxID=1237896 RepID=T0JL14_COLGC|nr:hypothetical protein CGLO_17440 [Colletotrichum gloeosporioides Cg-14]
MWRLPLPLPNLLTAAAVNGPDNADGDLYSPRPRQPARLHFVFYQPVS